MTRLSVNINKIATLRNARGGNNPNVLQVAQDCERFGAQGITVHPRPDERHIRYDDVLALKDVVQTDFNIEGYPDERFLKLIERVKPQQATLVPDAPNVLTSNAGWDTAKNLTFLSDVISRIHAAGVPVSIFMDPDAKKMEDAAKTGTDRIELYTEAYAVHYHQDRDKALKPYLEAAEAAKQLQLGVNAGHDLDLKNLKFLKSGIPWLEEVSIGHALVCDSIYLGLENTIQLYLRQLT
ncbi:MAG: pyridoxine 5'-phosphate synthase [Cyclobacteriaceae bacterium]